MLPNDRHEAAQANLARTIAGFRATGMPRHDGDGTDEVLLRIVSALVALHPRRDTLGREMDAKLAGLAANPARGVPAAEHAEGIRDAQRLIANAIVAAEMRVRTA